MERASSSSLRSLVTALAVVAAIAAIWVAAALANGSSDNGSSAGDSVRADLVQNQPEEEQEDDATPEEDFDEEDFFDRGGGGLFDGEDCPFGRTPASVTASFDDGPGDDPDEADPRRRPGRRLCRRSLGNAHRPERVEPPLRLPSASLLAAMHTTTSATWWQRTHGEHAGELLVAYFSMEFGLEESLPIYSGGLGVLAGDHLKGAAELGIPLVGVGLLYRGGYFAQSLDESGRQTEQYQPVDPEAAGLVREPVTVEIDLAGETIRRRCGARTSAPSRSTCSRWSGSRTRSTAATASTESARSSSSASAGYVRWRRSESSRASST